MAKEKHMPVAYTDKEGGNWLPWPGKALSEDFLERRREQNKGKTIVKIWGLKVHSLAFAEPGQFGTFPRWDVLNGWTTAIK